jgi:hypothetical protein
MASTENGAASFKRLLGGGENPSADCGRKLHKGKETRRIEIILPGFVDHPELTMLFGVSIGNDLVELPTLERYLVAAVAQA